MPGAHHRAVFEVGSRAYDLLTSHAVWREQAAGLAALAPAGRPARRVLDLGCGPGASAFALAEALRPAARVTGVDLARAMVRRARAHHARSFAHLAAGFLVADAARLPFPDGAFDLAAGHSFLYLVDDPAAVLAEVRRVLAPGGGLALMEPHAGGSLRRAARSAGAALAGGVGLRPLAGLRFASSMVLWRAYSAAVGRLTVGRLEDLLRAAGFADVTCRPTIGGLGLHAAGRRD